MPDSGKPQSHRETVYRYVKSGIISHTLKPGDMIHERALAEKLGVSRTPVREAIQALQNDGWLTVVPRKGTMVRPLKRVDVEEIIQLRKMVAVTSIPMGIAKVGPRELAYFETLMKRQEAAANARDATAFMEADMALHLSIVRLAGNRRLAAFSENQCDYFQFMGMYSLRREMRFEEAMDQHRRIVDALAQGDAGKATAEYLAHLDETYKELLAWISTS